MIKCSFKETIDLPNKRFRSSECMNKAEILIINDPCYGLCYRCSYEKAKAEIERLQSIIDKFVRHKQGCFMGEYNSTTTGKMKGCDCGLSRALKEK